MYLHVPISLTYLLSYSTLTRKVNSSCLTKRQASRLAAEPLVKMPAIIEECSQLLLTADASPRSQWQWLKALCFCCPCVRFGLDSPIWAPSQCSLCCHGHLGRSQQMRTLCCCPLDK